MEFVYLIVGFLAGMMLRGLIEYIEEVMDARNRKGRVL